MSTAAGHNKETLKEFFNLLERIVDDNNLNATRIYNMDETGLTTVQKKPRKVIPRLEIPQVCLISGEEREINTKAVCCVSATAF
jgi:hypothetical protein